MKFPCVRLFCRDAGPASNPSLATRNLLRIPYILYTLSYLLAASGRVAFAWDDEDSFDSRKARERQEMRDFLGAVYKGQGALNITSGTLAQGSEGAIVRTGNTFTTPRGVYVKVGDNWFLPNGEGVVRRVGSSFLGPEDAVASTGTTYLGRGGNAVAAGQAVFRNYSKTKKEDTE